MRDTRKNSVIFAGGRVRSGKTIEGLLQSEANGAIFIYMKRIVEILLFVLLTFSISFASVIHRVTVCHGDLEETTTCSGLDLSAVIIPVGPVHAVSSAHDNHAEHHEHCLQKLCSASANSVTRFSVFAGVIALPVLTNLHLFPLFRQQHIPMQPVVKSAPQRSPVLTI